MIDPNDVIKYDRTEAELEEFWLFCILVAGKKATTQAVKLEHLLLELQELYGVGPRSPFDLIRSALDSGSLDALVRKHRVGQYSRIISALIGSLYLPSLKNVVLGELTLIRGIGPKTARMFLMFTRPNQRLAVLDTHILKYLKAQDVKKVPKNTPATGRNYDRLEQEFLRLADKAGKRPSEFDLEIWRTYANT